ncbi:protein transport protein gos1 [Thecaphora frezii]
MSHPSPSPAIPPWETLRRTTRNLESTLDARITTYSQLPSLIASSPSPLSASRHTQPHLTLDLSHPSPLPQNQTQHQELEHEIQTLLQQLSTSVDHLTSLLDDPTHPPSSSQLHAVQRHREVLLDLERDFTRARSNVRHAIDRRDLLGSVRDDIETYKAQHASDADALLAERGHIDNSHRMLDRTLEQAYATRAELGAQHSLLSDVSTRMSTAAAYVPALNTVISLIGRRRKRDSVILGVLIGSCTVVLLMMVSR